VVIVPLGMIEIVGLLERGVIPVEVLEPSIDMRISMSDIPDVAFEMAHVDWVEADDSGIEPYVGLRQPVSDEIDL